MLEGPVLSYYWLEHETARTCFASLLVVDLICQLLICSIQYSRGFLLITLRRSWNWTTLMYIGTYLRYIPFVVVSFFCISKSMRTPSIFISLVLFLWEISRAVACNLKRIIYFQFMQYVTKLRSARIDFVWIVEIDECWNWDWLYPYCSYILYSYNK